MKAPYMYYYQIAPIKKLFEKINYTLILINCLNHLKNCILPTVIVSDYDTTVT